MKWTTPKPRPEILFHPNIPKPLHGMSPRTIFGHKWWESRRRFAYLESRYHCVACGVYKTKARYHQWLEAHELYEFDYKNGRLIFKEIVALCHACHNYIHSGRMQILVRRGKMPELKMEEILEHGDSIIRKAKLRWTKSPKECAPWDAWRLVIAGKEYKGKFATYNDWRDFYGY